MPLYVYFNGQTFSSFSEKLLLQSFWVKNAKNVFFGEKNFESSFHKIDVKMVTNTKSKSKT